MAAHVDGACPTKEHTYLDENRVAMNRMMAGMNIASTGHIDRDFAMAMIAHHQGAIDMARAELRHGDDPTLRRIAQGIVVEQQQESRQCKSYSARRRGRTRRPTSKSSARSPGQSIAIATIAKEAPGEQVSDGSIR